MNTGRNMKKSLILAVAWIVTALNVSAAQFGGFTYRIDSPDTNTVGVSISAGKPAFNVLVFSKTVG